MPYIAYEYDRNPTTSRKVALFTGADAQAQKCSDTEQGHSQLVVEHLFIPGFHAYYYTLCPRGKDT